MESEDIETSVKERKKQRVRFNTKKGKPDNVIEREIQLEEEASRLMAELPSFMRGFYMYLKRSVLPMTVCAYLRDIRFFCQYLIENTDLTSAKETKKIKASEFSDIQGVDVNIFLDYCRRYAIEDDNGNITIYENGNRALARKKSSLSVLFRYLYREDIIDKSISDKLEPVRVPSAADREIKALQEHEVMLMLDAVTTGSHLTKKERQYWEKTKKRDKAILVLFVTYGLRLSELQQLNVSSFNFDRGEFIIYRKRGKESAMPLNNKTVLKALHEYIDLERAEIKNIKPGCEDALFLSIQGGRMTDRQIRELVKKYTSIAMSTSRSAGYSPHKLRATAATSLIGRGNSIFDVQQLLDHENVTTTQLYAAHKANTRRELIGSFEWDDEFDGKKE